MIPVIAALPDPPLRGVDTGEVFSEKTDAWHQGVAGFPAALNDFGPDLVDAAAAAGYSTVSVSNVAIGIGAKSFTVETGKMFVRGQLLTIADTAAPTTNYMWAQIDAYNFTTGVLDVTVLKVWGSGTKSAWNIGLSGPQGPEGGAMLTSPTIVGTLTEASYAITDGASVVIDPANGSRQRWTLGANRTPTTTLANGQSVLLFIDDGAAYSITWSSIGVTWKTNAGVAPTLNTTGFTMIVLTKENGVIYGARVGDA